MHSYIALIKNMLIGLLFCQQTSLKDAYRHCRHFLTVYFSHVLLLISLLVSPPPQPVEVPTMLSGLRQQRMLMVQTISQYKFVYQVLIQFLKNSRLI